MCHTFPLTLYKAKINTGIQHRSEISRKRINLRRGETKMRYSSIDLKSQKRVDLAAGETEQRYSIGLEHRYDATLVAATGDKVPRSPPSWTKKMQQCTPGSSERKKIRYCTQYAAWCVTRGGVSRACTSKRGILPCTWVRWTKKRPLLRYRIASMLDVTNVVQATCNTFLSALSVSLSFGWVDVPSGTKVIHDFQKR